MNKEKLVLTFLLLPTEADDCSKGNHLEPSFLLNCRATIEEIEAIKKTYLLCGCIW